ncbi:MAG: alpha/beta fold hydrolase [Chloroflexota bacterium]
MSKKKLRGLKRRDIQFDFDLYRTSVPIRGVAGADLSVLDLHPAGATKTIMFVHGYAGVLESWEFQINHFVAQNFRVVAPDLRGHGQSDAPYTQYTMAEMVSDLQSVVEHLDFPDQFILVAHSFGGSIATEYANAYPERLEKLVLIATAGEFPLPKIANWALRLPLRLFRPLWRFRPRWDAELHVVKRLMANNMRHWKGWTLLENITTPTLVLTGERDNYFPRYVYEDVGKHIPGAEVYDVGSAKHKVQLERYEAVNRAIERFVGGDQRQSWRTRGQEASTLSAERPWLRSYPPNVPATIPIPKRPLTQFLESTAQWLPKRTATVFYDTKLSYEELNEQVNQFAHVLHGLGISPGNRVMIVLPNMPQMIVAFYATLKVGGVVVLPNPDADAATIVGQAIKTGAKVLVTLTSFSRMAQAVQQRSNIIKVVFADISQVVRRSTYRSLLQRWGIAESEAEDYELAKSLGSRMSTLMQDAPFDAPNIEVSSNDLAVVIFTSGTTSEPKGVCLTHANLVANTMQTRHWLTEMQYGREVCLAVLPLLHSYGLTNAMNIPFALGATIVLLPVFDTKEVLEHIKEYGVTMFPGVPTMYTAINQVPNVRDYDLQSVKACVSGAAPLPIEVQEAFEKLTRGDLVEGYGLTEASPVTHANPLSGQQKPGSIGIPIPNTEARIVDMETGETLRAGEIGELVIRGPQVMQGYWGDDQNDAVRDGWLHTGDVAVMDSDGYFQIISRMRDTIMFGEYNVYPRDVEEVLYENNKVLETAVVGINSPDGQRVKAYVVPRPGTNLTVEELIELCKKRLEPYAVPWKIEFRDSLPKSFIGKVLRRLLVQEPDNEPKP